MQMLMHCPGCQAHVSVPPAASGKAARCPHCRQVFRVPRTESVIEETITCWLDEEEERDIPEPTGRRSSAVGESAVHAAAPPRPQVPPQDQSLAPPRPAGERPGVPDSHSSSIYDAVAHSPDAEGSTVAVPRVSYVSRHDAAAAAKSSTSAAAPSAHRMEEVAAIDRHTLRLSVLGVTSAGVRLGFPIAMLGSVRFRASMPFCCVGCQDADPKHLIARPIPWVDKVTGKFANAAELEATYEIHVRNQASVADVLGDMRPMDELASPFNDPLPYFVCHRCAPEVHLHGSSVGTQQGVVCEVLIPSGVSALAWLGRVNGICGDEYARLEDLVNRYEDDSWKGIPEDVRKRLSGWFDFRGGERFVAYFPDSDFGRKEHGLAGIVLTDQRYVYCKFHHHGGAALSDKEPLMAVKDGPFYELIHHRRKMLRLRREDAYELAKLLEDMKSPLQLQWT